MKVGLFAGNNQPGQQIQAQAGYTARDESDEKSQAEPEGTDAEKFTQAAAHAKKYPIMARASQ